MASLCALLCCLLLADAREAAAGTTGAAWQKPDQQETTNRNSGDPRNSQDKQHGLQSDSFVKSLPEETWGNIPLASLPPLPDEQATTLRLARHADDGGLAAIQAALEGDVPQARYLALSLLQDLFRARGAAWEKRPEYLPQILASLASDTPEIRAQAARLIAEYDEENAAKALTQVTLLLRDGKTFEEQYAAVLALSAMGNSGQPAAPMLVRRIREPVRLGVSEYLDCLGKLNCLAEIQLFLPEVQQSLPEFQLRMYAERAMGYLRPMPQEILDDFIRRVETGEPEGGPIFALGRVRPTTPEVVEALTKSLKSSKWQTQFLAGIAAMDVDPKAPGIGKLLQAAVESDSDQVRARIGEIFESADLSEPLVIRLCLVLHLQEETNHGFLSRSKDVLKRLSPAGFDELQKIVLGGTSDSLEFRCAAAFLLGRIVEDRQRAIPEDSRLSADYAESLANTVAAWPADESLELDVRASAALGLSSFPDKNFPLIVQAVNDARLLRVRRDAIDSLASAYRHSNGLSELFGSSFADDHPEALGAFIQALSQTEGDVAALAAQVLATYEAQAQQALPALFAALENPQLERRGSFVEAIADIGDPTGKSLDRLLKLYSGETDDFVRDEMLKTFGRMAGSAPARAPEVLSVLLAALDDESLAAAATQGLSDLGPAASAAASLMIEQARAAGTTSGAASACVDALGKIPADPKVAVPYLIEAMDEKRLAIPALSALVTYGKDASPSLPKLAAVLDTNLGLYETRIEKTWAISMIVLQCDQPSAELVDPLREKLSAPYQSNFQLLAAALFVAAQGNGDAQDEAAGGIFRSLQAGRDREELAELQKLLGQHWQAVLTAGLRQSDEDLQQTAVRIALKGGDRELAVQIAMEDIESNDPDRRTVATRLLRSLGELAKIEAVLVREVRSENEAVRLAAAQALISLRGHAVEAVPVLAEASLLEMAADPDAYPDFVLDDYPRASSLLFWKVATDNNQEESRRLAAWRSLRFSAAPVPLSAAEFRQAIEDSDSLTRQIAALCWANKYAQITEKFPDSPDADAMVANMLAAGMSPHEELRESAIRYLAAGARQQPEFRQFLWTLAQQGGTQANFAISSLAQAGMSDEAWDMLFAWSQDDSRRSEGLDGLRAAMSYESQWPEDLVKRMVGLLKELHRSESDDDFELSAMIRAVSANPRGLAALLELSCEQDVAPELRRRAIEPLWDLLTWERDVASRRLAMKGCEALLADQDPELRLPAALLLLQANPEHSLASEAVSSFLNSHPDELADETLELVVAALQRTRHPGCRQEMAAWLRRRMSTVTGGDQIATARHLAALTEDANDLRVILQVAASATEPYEKSSLAASLNREMEGAIPILIEALASPDPSLQHAAAQMIYSSRPAASEAREALAACLKGLVEQEEPPRDALVAVAVTLSHVDPQNDLALATLLAALEAEDGMTDSSEVRIHAILTALMETGSRAAPARTRAAQLLRSDESFTTGAALLLGAIGPEAQAAVPDLLAATNVDPESAFSALARIGPAAGEAVPRLQVLLGEETLMEFAADALAQIGTADQVAAAVEQLLQQTADPALAEPSIAALAVFGGNAKSAFPRIVELTSSDDPQLADAALHAVGALHEHLRDGVSLLIAKLDDPMLRASALHALRRCGAAAAPAVPRLIAILESDDEPNYIRVLSVLQKLGPAAPNAVEPLQRFQKRQDLGSELADEIELTLTCLQLDNSDGRKK